MRAFSFVAAGRAAWCIVLAVAVSGCGSLASAIGFNQDTTGQCGSPPPVPSPFLFLAYPGDGTTNVPTTIGRLVFAGFAGSSAISVDAPSGNGVSAGPLVPAPSPLPSPLATLPPRMSGSVPYYAASVPALAPSTTYTVIHSYSEWSSKAPCTQAVNVTLGSFTTQ